MKGSSFVYLAAAALLASTSSSDARLATGSAPERAVPHEGLFQLAQVRSVEIFYDRYGREILMDRETGEVVGVREPNGAYRRMERAPERLQQRGYEYDREFEYPNENTVRLRRQERMRELDRLPDYREFPRDYRPREEAYPPYEEEYAREEPLYDDRSYDRPAVAPDYVERSPLGNGSVVTLPDRGQQPGAVIGDPGAQGTVPDVANAPQIPAGTSEEVASFQVLLSRVGASPGVIDGRMGDNVNKAIAAYKTITGETLRTYDKAYVDAQLAATGGDAFTTYEITSVDAAGPYVASVPEDYGEKAKLERLGYVSVAEMLAEKFHMDEKYLRALNPGVNFDRPGTIVRVANVSRKQKAEVARIIADKGEKQVRAYDATGRLVVAYPATIGSQSTPSPTGTHTVKRIALNPEYTYNPKINFKQGNNDQVLTIPPGPNGPVGSVWIALSKPTYGIHGTPEPSKIGKTESNGCIRLTNWDAEQLAKMVKEGVSVEFVE